MAASSAAISVFTSSVKGVIAVGYTGRGYGSTFHDGLLRLKLDHILFDEKYFDLNIVKMIGDNKWSDHNAMVAGFDDFGESDRGIQ